MTRVLCDFCMTPAAHALEIACDSRKQKLNRLNGPLNSKTVFVYVEALQRTHKLHLVQPQNCLKSNLKIIQPKW